MALEALKSREQAALFHAAHADLQVALMEAESGNDRFLQRWLEKYRSLMQEDPELERHLSSVQSTFDFAESAVNMVTDQVVPLGDARSPWPAMIAGANRRAKHSNENLPMLSTEQPELSKASVQTPDKPSGSKRLLTSADVEEIRDPVPVTKRDTVLLSSKQIDEPFVVPESLQGTLLQEKKANSKKKWAWLSSSVIGSTAAHFLALVVMSTYMIHLARNPEPKAIMASTVDTETISMEAPAEMSTIDPPTLDPSESQMPTLPSFADVASASSSALQLPSSMTGLVTGDSASPTDNAIQQATNSSKSNAAANSVQFFGVKAAGNTFCYVVDGSPSMKKDNAFAAAKAELVRSLSLLKPKQRFYISFFGSEIERMKLGSGDEEPYPVYATPENLQKTLIWIERVRVQDNGLAPNKALTEAIKMDPDGIFLLFDGDTKVDVAEYLRKANRSDDLISGGTPLVPIHTIGFYTPEFEALMKRIAIENNGVYRFVPNPMKPR